MNGNCSTLYSPFALSLSKGERGIFPVTFSRQHAKRHDDRRAVRRQDIGIGGKTRGSGDIVMDAQRAITHLAAWATIQASQAARPWHQGHTIEPTVTVAAEMPIQSR